MPGKRSKKPKKLPRFDTDEELGKFIDENDLGDYLDGFAETPVSLDLSPELRERIQKRSEERFKKRLLSLRLENRQVEDAKRIARRKGIAYQTLMRLWIQEGIEREKNRSGTDG